MDFNPPRHKPFPVGSVARTPFRKYVRVDATEIFRVVLRRTTTGGGKRKRWRKGRRRRKRRKEEGGEAGGKGDVMKAVKRGGRQADFFWEIQKNRISGIGAGETQKKYPTGTPARTQKKEGRTGTLFLEYRTPKPCPARIPVPDLACQSSILII